MAPSMWPGRFARRSWLLLPLLVVLMNSACFSSRALLPVKAQQVCALPGYSLSPLDSRFCCPTDSGSERFVLDVSSVSDGRTSANCRSCRTSESAFNDCRDTTGGADICCAGRWNTCRLRPGYSTARCCSPSSASDCSANVLTASTVKAAVSLLPTKPNCMLLDGSGSLGNPPNCLAVSRTDAAGNATSAWSCSCSGSDVLTPVVGSYRSPTANEGGSVSAGHVFLCPDGSFCAGGDAAPVICPRGKFCPRGAGQPLDCPPFKMCVLEGLVEPETCPPGRLCDSQWVLPANAANMTADELRASTPLCPGGFLCVDGVVTYKCFQGTICPAGTAPRLRFAFPPDNAADPSDSDRFAYAYGQFAPRGAYAPTHGMAAVLVCPSGTYDNRDDFDSTPSTSCDGRCSSSITWGYKDRQYSSKCDLNVGAIVTIVCVVGPVALALLYCLWWCDAAETREKEEKAELAVKAAREQAEKKAREKALQEEEKKREEDERPAVAVELSQSVGRLRIEVSARLARDAVQGALNSAMHANLMTQLNQQGRAREVAARYTQLVESAISHALVECELDKDCRLLSLMSLNPQRLPPPSLLVFSHAALVTAVGDALEPFVLALRAEDAAADNGFGREGAATPVPGAAPAAVAASASAFASAPSGGGSGQLALASEAASAAVQRECAQFASAWLMSTEASLREPLKRPPSLSDLQRDAAGAWKAALALPTEATVVDLPADPDAETAAGSESGSDSNEDDGGGVAVSDGSGDLLRRAYPSPSAPPHALLSDFAFAGRLSGGSGSSGGGSGPGSSVFSSSLTISRPSFIPAFAAGPRTEGVHPPPTFVSDLSSTHVIFVAPAAAASSSPGAAAFAASGDGIELQSPHGGASPVHRGDAQA